VKGTPEACVMNYFAIANVDSMMQVPSARRDDVRPQGWQELRTFTHPVTTLDCVPLMPGAALRRFSEKPDPLSGGTIDPTVHAAAHLGLGHACVVL
jgi:hypothetical protein